MNENSKLSISSVRAGVHRVESSVQTDHGESVTFSVHLYDLPTMTAEQIQAAAAKRAIEILSDKP